MKKIITLFAILFFSSVAAASEGTVLKISEIVKVGNVVVKPGVEYAVDLSGYEIKDAKLIVFHVLGSGSHYYYQKIKPGKVVYQMNAKTLKETSGSPSFKGLTKSDGVFLIIGSEVEKGSINRGLLYANESIVVIVRD